MSTQTLIVVAVIVLLIVILAIFILRRLQGQQASASSRDTISEDDLKNNQIYVGNLSYSVSEGDLRRFFQEYGIISDVRIVRNNKTGRSKGFAFITYKEITQADRSLEANGKQLQSRKLVVRIAKPRV